MIFKILLGEMTSSPGPTAAGGGDETGANKALQVSLPSHVMLWWERLTPEQRGVQLVTLYRAHAEDGPCGFTEDMPTYP